jgi:hypothetical protein
MIPLTSFKPRLPHYENTEVEVMLCIKDFTEIDSIEIYHRMRVLRPKIPFEVVDMAVQNIEKRLTNQAEPKWFTELIFWFMETNVARQSKKKRKLAESLLLSLSEDSYQPLLVQSCKSFSIKPCLLNNCLSNLVDEGFIHEIGSMTVITESGKAAKKKIMDEAIAIIKDTIS